MQLGATARAQNLANFGDTSEDKMKMLERPGCDGRSFDRWRYYSRCPFAAAFAVAAHTYCWAMCTAASSGAPSSVLYSESVSRCGFTADERTCEVAG